MPRLLRHRAVLSDAVARPDRKAMQEHSDNAAATEPALTTYYNGACPVCRPAVERYAREAADAGRGDLAWQDIAADDTALAALGLAREAVKERLHAVDAAGCVHIGVDAFIAIWRELPGRRRLARLLALPPVHGAAAAGYDRVLAPLLYRWNRWHGR
jgi:predicted DCC family thiol-disulfide oxidoreductase YuxK